MPRLKLFLCSSGCSVDIRTNQVSIFDVLEDFQPAGYPFFIQKMEVTTMWEKQEGEGDIFDANLIILNNGIELFRQPLTINFQGSLRTRFIATLKGLTIQNPGIIEFRILLGTDLMGTYSMTASAPPIEIPTPTPAT